jgi:pyruvate dehydrogenase E2 component (dihydrolipoamide acetyltransferase)
MSVEKIIVPNVGDFKDIEIIEVLVEEGQTIKKNDSLITLESDKSSVEVPSTFEGVIEKINVKIGEKVNQGDLILTLKAKEKAQSKQIIEKNENAFQKPAFKKEIKKSVAVSSNQNNNLASPKVRKFARELGSNIAQIPGSQRSGRVIEEDIKKFIKSQSSTSKTQVEKKNYKD